MSTSVATAATPAALAWHAICAVDDIEPGTGAAALVGQRQIALFRPDGGDRLFALGNFDPFSRAMVLARGLLGDHDGVAFVASPVYKQRFRLDDGRCLDDPERLVPSYPVRISAGRVSVGIPS